MNTLSNGRVHHASDAGANPAAAPPARILCVEDDLALRNLQTLMLTHSGYVVHTAADGAEAWAALQDSHYDLLLTDNLMPHLSGVELIQKVRQARLTVPIILTSGMLDALPQDVLSALECEALLLAKPFTRQQLLSCVREVLRVGESTKLHPASVRWGAEEFHSPLDPRPSRGINAG